MLRFFSRDKKNCWDLIRESLNSHQLGNIVLDGDLNVTLSLREKKGGSIVRDPIREWVEDIIMEWYIDDIKPSCGKFTWSNKRIGSGHIVARLNRFLIQNSFLILGLNVVSKILPFSASDHKPILLELSKDTNLGPVPFRFSPSWIQQEGFQDLVLNVWQNPVSGSPFFV